MEHTVWLVSRVGRNRRWRPKVRRKQRWLQRPEREASCKQATQRPRELRELPCWMCVDVDCSGEAEGDGANSSARHLARLCFPSQPVPSQGKGPPASGDATNRMNRMNALDRPSRPSAVPSTAPSTTINQKPSRARCHQIFVTQGSAGLSVSSSACCQVAKLPKKYQCLSRKWEAGT